MPDPVDTRVGHFPWQELQHIAKQDVAPGSLRGRFHAQVHHAFAEGGPSWSAFREEEVQEHRKRERGESDELPGDRTQRRRAHGQGDPQHRQGVADDHQVVHQEGSDAAQDEGTAHGHLIVSLSVPLMAAGKATITIRFRARTLSTPQGHLRISVRISATTRKAIR